MVRFTSSCTLFALLGAAFGCHGDARLGPDGFWGGIVIQEELLDIIGGNLPGGCSTGVDGFLWCEFECGDGEWCIARIDPDTVRRVVRGKKPAEAPNPQRSAQGFMQIAQGPTLGELVIGDLQSAGLCEWVVLNQQPSIGLPQEAPAGLFPVNWRDWVDGSMTYDELYAQWFPNLVESEQGFSGWEPLAVSFKVLGLGSSFLYVALPWDYQNWGEPLLFDDMDVRYPGICPQEHQHLETPVDPDEPASWLKVRADIGVLEIAGRAGSVLQWLHDRVAPDSFLMMVDNGYIPGYGTYEEVAVLVSFDYDDHTSTVALSTASDPEAHFAHTAQLLP